MPLARAHVLYSGYVQGVGFRYTARSVASRFQVTGWVRNLADGSVELEAQGEREEVRAYLGSLSERMSRNIRDAKTCWISPASENGFSVRF
jgi:acylphosphatase